MIITLQQLYTFIITFTQCSNNNLICNNVLKEVSSAQQGCIYLYRCLIQEGGLKINKLLK